MALLDFQCLECGSKFSELVYSSTRELINCPECGSRQIKQIFEGKSYGRFGSSSGGSGECSGGSCASCSGCGCSGF